VHPLLATIFLMSIKPDLNTIAACILHDVIEDTEYTYDDIKNKFNEDVAELCEGMVKVSKLKYRGEERQIETLKKTFFAFSKDLRVIFIKLADRIHNIQTLHYHPNPEKQARIAEETLQIYVPIAKRLGLYEFQSLLENGSFKILHPQEFSQIINYLDNKYIINSKIISEGTKDIEKVLSDHGLEADVK
jgi:GTP pyrophosphokinase